MNAGNSLSVLRSTDMVIKVMNCLIRKYFYRLHNKCEHTTPDMCNFLNVDKKRGYGLEMFKKM